MAVVTVSQLNNYLKRYFDNNIHLQRLWVKGEISNYKKHYTGHMYLTLKDDTSLIKAVMFKGNASKLRFAVDNGMKVIACGRVAVFERDGQYQLYIESMAPDGMGELHLAYEQLKEKLSKEGLFEESHKKPIPKYPARIGVITSPTGAAIRDILNILGRRYTAADVFIYPAQVQGDGAADTVVAGIKCFNRLKNVDVIIAGRGGGSIEDLWAFNEEKVARAIFDSQIPIISAVGHETDFTIADFVADLRAPTPSAGAELAAPSAAELKHMLIQTRARLSLLLSKLYEKKRKQLDLLLKSRVFTDSQSLFSDRALYLDKLIKAMGDAYKANLNAYKNRFSNLMAKLSALNPVAVLGRGYSIAKKDGMALKSAKSLKAGDKISILLYEGSAQCTVDKVDK